MRVKDKALKNGVCPVCKGSRKNNKGKGICAKCRGTGKLNGSKSKK